MAGRFRQSALGSSAALLAAGALLVHPAAADAAAVTAGAPTDTIPASLSDPLGSLVPPLPAGQFLLPIEIVDASGLQTWGFDLWFDAGVANPLDVGGLYQSVYAWTFNALDPTLSELTSGGLPLPGLLAGIAGFSSGVSGDGTLACILFQYEHGQEGNDPGFVVDNAVILQTPEPGPLVLLAAALLTLSLLPRRRGAPGALRTLAQAKPCQHGPTGGPPRPLPALPPANAAAEPAPHAAATLPARPGPACRGRKPVRSAVHHQQETAMKATWMSVLGAVAAGSFAVLAAPASAQTTANGPYHATPSWGQELPCDTASTCPRFVVLANWGNEAVLDRETGIVWEREPNVFPFEARQAWGGAVAGCVRKQRGRRQGLAPADGGRAELAPRWSNQPTSRRTPVRQREDRDLPARLERDPLPRVSGVRLHGRLWRQCRIGRGGQPRRLLVHPRARRPGVPTRDPLTDRLRLQTVCAACRCASPDGRLPP